MVEFDVPARLETEIGTLYFNDPTPGTGQSGYFALVDADCKAQRTLRTATDKVPQSDGEIFHRRFRDATDFTLVVALWEDENTKACGGVRRQMEEELIAHLNSLVNGPGRYFWLPSDYGDERMLEACRYSVPIERSFENGVLTCTFHIDSPYPYVIDKTQLLLPVPGDGTPTVITMPDFSADFWPVMKAQGPTTAFSIQNNDVTDEYGDPLLFWYDAARPAAQAIAAAHYGEIVTFNETMYLDGNLANLKPGIDPEVTDYFFLRAGDNEIVAIGADVDFLVNYAWAVA